MFVADLHNDLVQRVMVGEDITIDTKKGHTDIARLLKSKIDFEILVVWASIIPDNESPFEHANCMYDKIENIVLTNNMLSIPKNLDEIIENKNNNLLSLPIAMEGGEPIENSINNLNHFIDRGMFYFGPTWNHSLEWVSSGYDETYNKNKLKCLGLNEFGKEVVQVCNDRGVIIDVSHIGEKSFWDISSVATKPFIASHSSVYNLSPHFRNLRDDQIFEIKRVEGLVGLNPYPFFIDSTFKQKEEKFIRDFKDELNQIHIREKNKNASWIAKQHFLQKKLKNIVPSLDIYINHIEYIIALIGIDYVAIGSDYDGLDCLPQGWDDCMDHMIVSEALDKRGYSSQDIEKVMGNNILRVYEEVSK